MKTSLRATAASFAHLLGRPAVPRAADDAPKQRDDESDEDFKKRRDEAADDGPQREGESDDDYKKRKDKAAKAKAEVGEDGEDGEDGQDGRDGRDGRDGQNADDQGDDTSDDTDMRDKSARPARLRERERCAAIFADAAAGKNPDLAATLAFKTNMPRGQAIKVLRAGSLAVTGRNALDRRMESIRSPVISAGDITHTDSRAPAQRAADQVVIAGMKRRGESPEAINAFVAQQARG